jgi:hypothetical protein
VKLYGGYEIMLYVIGYLLVSVVFVGILFYLIDHSPSGFEDENGFHFNPERAPQLATDWIKPDRPILGMSHKYSTTPRSVA